MSNTAIALFEHKQIRKIWYENEWRFSIDDVVIILVESKDIRQYLKKMKARDPMLQVNRGTICTPLEMIAKDGKKRKILCSNAE